MKKTDEQQRALAHIEKVVDIQPIEGADNIELITVLGWRCIAKKNEFQIGDLAIYIEIDSKVPEDDERFKFLESKKYKIQTMKLSKFNVISQGIALPTEKFTEVHDKQEGEDVTDLLRITYSSSEDIQRKANLNPNDKYRAMSERHKNIFKKPLIKKIMRYSIGRKIMFMLFGKKKDKPLPFPSWISKTDEQRIENMPWILESKEEWVATEKIDGCSATYALDLSHRKPDNIVCSRNMRLQQSIDNHYFEIADKYKIFNLLLAIAKKGKYKKVVLQGEIIGPKIQGNPYKLTSSRLYIFNLILDGNRINSIKGKQLIDSLDFEYKPEWVPILGMVHLHNNMEDMKLEADGDSILNSKTRREGIVYRTIDGKQSFKNVSRKYLLKH